MINEIITLLTVVDSVELNESDILRDRTVRDGWVKLKDELHLKVRAFPSFQGIDSLQVVRRVFSSSGSSADGKLVILHV